MVNKHCAMLAALCLTTNCVTMTPAAKAAEDWSRYNSSAYYRDPNLEMPGVLNQAWSKTPCRDPWINIAYSWAMNRSPRGSGDLGECNPALYAGARWTDYNQLVHGIALTLRILEGNNLQVFSSANGSYIKALPTGISATLVSQGGGNIVAQGGANLIAKGGAKAYRLQSTSEYFIWLSGNSMIIFKP
jgi:hypothetical protein